MATAAEYGQWIVENEDKKGTPEFEEVVAAYQKARSMDAAVEEVQASTYAAKPAMKVAEEAFFNIPSSAYQMGKGVVEAIASPIDTADTLTKLGAGILQLGLTKMGAGEMVDAIGKDEKSIQIARAVGDFYLKRYGSEEGIKKAIATDPVGVVGDLAVALKAAQVATIPAKSAGLGGIPDKLGKAAAAIEPLNIAAGVAKSAPVAVSEAFGGLTGTGGLPIREGFKAGAAGGQKSQSFTDAMRGVSDPLEVVDQFKANLAEFRDRRNSQYNQMMASKVANDPAVLSFDGIDDAITKAIGRVTYKGQITDPLAAKALNEAWAKIDEWKNLEPAEFHTPEGMDRLKQQVGAIVQGLPIEQKNARQSINDLYNSIKSEIVKQAPDYARIMKGYSDATDLIRQIEQSLSMGSKASADTQLRKLTSVMRNNVNTNYGARTKLVDQLEGQPYEVMPALAGQSMSGLAPRGIQGATSPLAAIGLGLYNNPVVGLGLAAASSPRLVGEAAHAAGQTARPFAQAGRLTIEQVDKIINSVPQLEYLKFVKDPAVRMSLFMQVQTQAAQQQEQQ